MSISLKKEVENLIRAAILAPSSHNTQPWLFSYDDKSISVFVDPRRRLAIADPTDRELYVSIGCAIGNILIAAPECGLQAVPTFFPQPKEKFLAAKIHIEKTRKKSDKANNLLFKAIAVRLSNRFPYLPKKKVSPAVLKQLQAYTKTYGIHLSIFTDPKMMEKFAVLTRDGIKSALSDPAFREELSHWLRHNWTKKEDGLPGYTIGLNDAMSIAAPAMIRSPMIAEPTSQMEYQMIKSAAGVGIISTKNDTPTCWVQAGIALEHIWLYMTNQGVSFSMLSAAVEMEKERVQTKALLQETYFPAAFFRFGYPTKKSRSSPRRTLEHVLKQ